MSLNPIQGKSFLHVTYPAPETYYIIPAEWKLEDITVNHGELFYKGVRTFIIPRDFHSGNPSLEIIAEGHMDFPDCHEFIHN
jgi:hypothetical protein